MLNGFRRALRASIDLLLPPACLLCGRLLAAEQGTQALCRGCLSAVVPLPVAHCSLCAQPFPNATSSHLCGNCLKRPPLFARVHVAGLYQGTIKTAIHKLKYRNQLVLARPLGQLLGNAIAAADETFVPDLVVPVPLHLYRLRARGYNQALEIARAVTRLRGIPCHTTLLRRTRKTPQQQGLSAIERRSNLRNAFTLAAGTPPGKVLLVDDVMTTGETVRECCRTLTAGGVKEIHVAIVGRA